MATPKSTNLAIIGTIGMMILGNYTLVIKDSLLIKLEVEAVNAAEK